MVFPENENSNSAEEKKSLHEDFHDDANVDENLDDSKAKFLGNGKTDLDHDPHVVIEVGSEVSFTGLGKEELMKYANDPFWVRIRMVLFVVFWIGWVAMLIAAILIIVFAPKCPERPELKWYQTDIVYQINPKSFMDTSAKGDAGEGVGDLKGITSKISYLQGLDVNALYISAFYKSGVDSYDGNDVEDHIKVDQLYGTMADLEALRKTTKKKGMKLVVDFIPNHTGTKHEWFIRSQNNNNPSAAAADFYIWANSSGTDGSGNPVPPNNWETAYGESAWKYDDIRDQFYYFSYLPEYPDLNLRNPDVLNELDGVLRFWLDKGVDGFVIQGLQNLVEHEDVTESEPTPGTFTKDHTDNLKLVARWRNIINSYSDKPGRERALMAVVNGSANQTKQYSDAGIHVVITEALSNIDPDNCDIDCIQTSLPKSQAGVVWMGWMLDDGNRERFGSRVSEDLQKAFQAMNMLLPGTAFVYYGDEIAMTNGAISLGQAKDPLARFGSINRDRYRTPMLWTSGENAGFCASNITAWLPINPDYDQSKSVEHNGAHKNGYTLLESFLDVAKLRKKESFQFGSFEMQTLGSNILYFSRKAAGFPSYLVAVNYGGGSSVGLAGISNKMRLVYDSAGSEDVGQVYDTSSTPIAFKGKGEVLVLEY